MQTFVRLSKKFGPKKCDIELKDFESNFKLFEIVIFFLNNMSVMLEFEWKWSGNSVLYHSQF